MYQFQDSRPDRRRHAVPVCDKLSECRVSADIVQPLAPMLDATIVVQNDLRILGRGCNSRRLHFLCHSYPYYKDLRLAGLGLVSRRRIPTVTLDTIFKTPEVRISKGTSLFSLRKIASWPVASCLHGATGFALRTRLSSCTSTQSITRQTPAWGHPQESSLIRSSRRLCAFTAFSTVRISSVSSRRIAGMVLRPASTSPSFAST